MKLNITKEILQELVGRLEKIASKTAALPILQCIHFKATSGTLSLKATNLEVGVELKTSASVTTEGEVAIQAGVISNLLSSLPTGVVVGLSATDGMVVVETPRGVFKLPTFPVEDFPTLPTITTESTLKVSAQPLAQALKLILPAVSTSTIKPELASVYVRCEGNVLTCVATDSFRLVEKQVSVPVNQSSAPILIPQRSVMDVVRVLEYCGESDVVVSLNNHQATIEKDGVFVTLRLTDGTYPNYSAIIPSTFSTIATVLRFDLIQALRAASIFANDVNQTRFTIEPSANTVTIHTESAQTGETTLSLDGELSGKSLTTSFNLRYVLDALQLLATDSVTLSFTGVDTPAIVQGVGDPSVLYLMMPMNR